MVATLNFNGLTSPTRLAMLDDFLKKQDIDLVFLQEVTHPNLHTIHRYIAHINEGTDRRGTAILAKEGIALTDIKRLPSDRDIAAKHNGLGLINIYAPSGTARRSEKENFFKSDLTYLLPADLSDIILAGDFNCLISNTGCTGQKNYSRALASVVRGFNLTGVWEANPLRHIYTHYTPTGASRIDRIYATKNLKPRKQGVETVAAAFTDHLAVVLRLSTDVPIVQRGRGYWRMNVFYLEESTFQGNFPTQWEKWQQPKKYYPDRITWWESYFKRIIRRLLMQEGAEHRRDRTNMENFYNAIYDILREPHPCETTATSLRQPKAKIVRLHNSGKQRVFLDNDAHDMFAGEEHTLYHALKMQRQESRMVQDVQDSQVDYHTAPKDILRTFTEFMRHKYDDLRVDEESFQFMSEVGNKKLPPDSKESLDAPINLEELNLALKKGQTRKSPCSDGICH